MSDFTLENRKNEVRYETFEWDNVWIDHANDKTTKRVLYIGDSISVEQEKNFQSFLRTECYLMALLHQKVWIIHFLRTH